MSLVEKSEKNSYIWTTSAGAHFVSVSVSTPHAGTDVMLLESFSTDASSHQQHGNNLTGKRRSSVTFEDQVEHFKGARPFLTDLLESSGSVLKFTGLLGCWLTSPNTLCPFCFVFFFFLVPADNGHSSCVQIHAEVHKSLEAFASSLAKAIETDAKLTLFGEEPALPGGAFSNRAAPRPRYLEGQRLRLESIDEGIVKDDRDEVVEEEEEEDKPT